MDKRKLSNMLLILTALIWGSAFVAQSIGMEYIGQFAPGHLFQKEKVTGK